MAGPGKPRGPRPRLTHPTPKQAAHRLKQWRYTRKADHATPEAAVRRRAGVGRFRNAPALGLKF